MEEKRRQGIREIGPKRALREGVLYLVIVGMLTERKLEKARREVLEAKGKKRGEGEGGDEVVEVRVLIWFFLGWVE